MRLKVSQAPRLVIVPDMGCWFCGHKQIGPSSPFSWGAAQSTWGRRCAPSLATASPPGPKAKAPLKMKGNCAIPQGKGEKAGAVNEYN